MSVTSDLFAISTMPIKLVFQVFISCDLQMTANDAAVTCL